MANDLEALKIDRGGKTRSRRRSRWPARIAGIAFLAVLVWLFQRPLVALVERLRLPEVAVGRALRREAGAAAAVTGTAANGYVVARKSAALSSDFPARLVEMLVVEGSRVSAGDIVARLYSDELEAARDRAQAELELAQALLVRAEAQRDLAQRALERLRADGEEAGGSVRDAAAQLEFARSDHGRVEALVAEGTLTRSRLDEVRRELAATAARADSAAARADASKAALAEGEQQVLVAAAAVEVERANVRAMSASLKQATAALDKAVIRAPFDGIVVQKEAEVGEVVSPNSQGGGSLTRGSVATMVDPASLEVQAEVPETTLAAVRIGGPALIYLDAWPSAPYSGRIDRIWPVADRQKGTIEVRVAFDQRDDKLRPEMGVRVVFLDQEQQPSTEAAMAVVLVPSPALVRIDGADGVFLVERDVLRFQPLTLGDERAGRTVVRTGLAGGEMVVLDPAGSLASGQRVRVKEGS